MKSGNELHISNLEWIVLRRLWNQKPLRIKKIYELNADGNSITSNTIRTAILRLMNKGVVSADKTSYPYHYFVVLDIDICQKNEVNRFIQRYFGGSTVKCVEYLLNTRSFSVEECNELLEILHRRKRLE